MKSETIKLHKKAESLKPLLEKAGFKKLEYFWYSDGFYRGNWKDMSLAIDRPESEQHDSFWEFGFKSVDENHFRVHLEAKIPIGEDYFRLDLRYYPETELHNREGYLGPTAVFSVENILEEDLTNLQKYVDYLLSNNYVFTF
jgi:hypothetical protein